MSQKDTNNKDITRKDAIKKMGSYAAFAALGTIIMLNPQKAQAQSVPSDPGEWGGFSGGGNSGDKSGSKWGKPKNK
tara:strand:+ start:281 stop:508 length:228 start_codon:yes stop_codon:yes gene_type:complete